MLALRYAAVLALALWTGGLVVVGAVAAPAVFDILGARSAAHVQVTFGPVFGYTILHIAMFLLTGFMAATLLIAG